MYTSYIVHLYMFKEENYFVTNVYMDIFKGYTCTSSIIHAA